MNPTAEAYLCLHRFGSVRIRISLPFSTLCLLLDSLFVLTPVGSFELCIRSPCIGGTSQGMVKLSSDLCIM